MGGRVFTCIAFQQIPAGPPPLKYIYLMKDLLRILSHQRQSGRQKKKKKFRVCYLAFWPLLCVRQCIAVCWTNGYVHWNRYTHAQPSPAPSRGTLAGSPYISPREQGGKVGSRFPADPGVLTGQQADIDGCQPGSSRYALVGSDERLIG